MIVEDKKSIGSAGGKAQGALRRAVALEKYRCNPNFCHHCGSVISVKEGQKVGQVRCKKFCNHSCSSKSANARFRNVDKVVPSPKPIPFGFLNSKTKGEVFKEYKNWQTARSTIRKMAVYVYFMSGRPSHCERCGYDKHIEVCHVKAVSEFDDNDKISEINKASNLLGLCPNCHWEFDNGIVTF